MFSHPIKIGVIGCANIAERFVLPAIKSLPEIFTLQAIASRNADKANDFAQKFKTNPEYTYINLINREDIDAVYIPLPNSEHYKWIRLALLAGKHVLVEKSMACNLVEVEELNALAKIMQLVLLENFQFRFHAQLAKMKSIIDDGLIGDIRVIKSSFGFPPFADKNNIRYSKELGGGALLDAGAYPLKIAQELLSQDLYVDSSSLFVNEDIGVDIWGAAQLKSKNSNIVVQASFGFDNAYQCNVEIWGSKGTLKSNRIFTSPPGVKSTLELSGNEGVEMIEIEACNHFTNMITYFASLINNPMKADVEYSSNITQAKLIEQLRGKVSE